MADITPDDIKYALSQLLAFYDKELTGPQWAMWWSPLSKFDRQAVIDAIREYPSVGKYAPRPAHLIELIEVNKQRPDTFNRTNGSVEGTYVPASPETAAAWRWMIAIQSKDTNMEMFPEALDCTAEQAERHLHIANHEAKACDQPGAIEDRYKLKSVWGDIGGIVG